MSAINAATGKVISWLIFLIAVLVFGIFSTRGMEISSERIEVFISTLAGGIFFAASADALVAAYRATVKKNIDVKISIDGKDIHVILPVDDKEELRKVLRNISEIEYSNEKREG